MRKTLTLHLSASFEGFIWHILADGDPPRLYLEVRNPQEKTVSFSALNLEDGKWLWKGVRFEEPWWISLAAIAGEVLLLTMYTNSDNPDKKSLIAYHVLKEEIIWWQNAFSLNAVNRQYVSGVDAKFPSKVVTLDVLTGRAVQLTDFDLGVSQNFPVIRPFQYEEGTRHFETVKQFLQSRLNVLPVTTIEYLEFEALILMSVFVRDQNLANYLYVFDTAGERVLEEKLGENLKGVGLDTFFIFSGQLIFVRNKNELKSYKIV